MCVLQEKLAKLHKICTNHEWIPHLEIRMLSLQTTGIFGVNVTLAGRDVIMTQDDTASQEPTALIGKHECDMDITLDT